MKTMISLGIEGGYYRQRDQLEQSYGGHKRGCMIGELQVAHVPFLLREGG